MMAAWWLTQLLHEYQVAGLIPPNLRSFFHKYLLFKLVGCQSSQTVKCGPETLHLFYRFNVHGSGFSPAVVHLTHNGDIEGSNQARCWAIFSFYPLTLVT